MKLTFDRGLLDYAFGLLWAMVVAPPAIAIHASSRSSWLVLIPVIPVLAFFLGWLLVQYRRGDWVGAQKQSWLTVHQRQGWHKRVRLIAAWLFCETVAVFAVSALVRGDATFLAAAGVFAGLIAAATACLTWVCWRQVLTSEGWRW